METELWSLKEKMMYTKENAIWVQIGGVNILATPKKEILVMRVR